MTTEWTCSYCGSHECWFDRTIEVEADGTEHGMCYRCNKCGRSDEEES